MSPGPRRGPNGPAFDPLPPEVEAVIREVLAAAELEMTDGRGDVEQELRAHFEDALAAGTPPEEVVRK